MNQPDTQGKLKRHVGFARIARRILLFFVLVVGIIMVVTHSLVISGLTLSLVYPDLLTYLGAEFSAGTVQSLAEVPIIGGDLQRLSTTGVSHYKTLITYHRLSKDYLISGHTTPKAIATFCEENKVYDYFPCNEDDISYLKRSLDYFKTDPEKFSSAFSSNDYHGLVVGLPGQKSRIAWLKLWFRPENGYFILYVRLRLRDP